MDRCNRCQAILEDGALRFVARLRLCGDYGALPDPETQAGPTADVLQATLDAAANTPESQLMETVVEEFSFVVCPSCRARLRQDPAGAATVPGPRGVRQ